MKNWFKLLFLALVLGTVVAQEREGCDIDRHNITDVSKYFDIFNEVLQCINRTVTEEKQGQLMDVTTTLDGFRQLFKDICPLVHEVTFCIEGVKQNLVTCENQHIAMNITLVTELVEDMLGTSCENNGDRLAHIFHGAFLYWRKPEHTALRRCVLPEVTYITTAHSLNTDFAFNWFNLYNSVEKFKKCLTHIDEEVYKSPFQWLMNMVSTTMKCKHLVNGTMILCSEMDTSNISLNHNCAELGFDYSYSGLEKRVLTECYSSIFNLDKGDSTYYTEIEWLKGKYWSTCNSEREIPTCLIENSIYGKLCLSQEEDKQFQLEIQAIEDAVLRVCVEDGARLTAVMNEVYKNTPDHGHAIRDCSDTVAEASKAHQGHAASTKNMRFYHNVAAFKKCIGEKLHATNDLALSVEGAFNDVLKKMKCVNPEDGNVVLCDNIHEH